MESRQRELGPKKGQRSSQRHAGSTEPSDMHPSNQCQRDQRHKDQLLQTRQQRLQ